MSLFDEHKAERRERILDAARKLVAERGYDGLTMRDLARAAKVSVPTLYNLFGSKDAILVTELEAVASTIARALPVTGDSVLARGRIAFDAGMQIIEASPAFFRAVIQMFMTSTETIEIRTRVEQGFVAAMAANLRAAQAAGQLADWASPAIVARHMYQIHAAGFLGWGLGHIDFETFRAATLSGCAHLLAGVARGPFAMEVEAELRKLQGPLQHLIDQEARDVATR
ncbi:MAG: helix-turn-helix domain-containing protein [Kofleriaceae bacterium]